jgi:hypothetical protein
MIVQRPASDEFLDIGRTAVIWRQEAAQRAQMLSWRASGGDVANTDRTTSKRQMATRRGTTRRGLTPSRRDAGSARRGPPGSVS